MGTPHKESLNMATRMQQRRGTAAEWTTIDPILAPGEIGFETDTSKFKIGDGVNAWSVLPSYGSIDSILDAAPETLNTLNELAAAMNDDPDFFNSITTSITDAVATAGAYSDSLATNYDAAGSAAAAQTAAESTASADATSKANAAQAAAESTASADATSKADAAETAANLYTDGRETAITTAYQSYADTAEADAKAYADTAIGNIPAVDFTGYATEGFTNTAVSDGIAALVDASPTALNTLNEISAALGDDPDFYTNVAASITSTFDTLNGNITLARTDLTTAYEAADADEVTNRNGAISTALATAATNADTAIGVAIDLEVINRNLAIEAESGVISTAYNLADTAVSNSLETYATTKADAAQAAAEATASADATAKADAAELAAGVYSDSAISTHNLDTTSVHGIADTSLLATTANVSSAQTAAQTYADGLASNYDAAGTAATAQTAAEGYTDGAVGTHSADTTSVHGIADTSKIVMSDAVSTTLDGALVVSGDFTVNGTNFNASATSITIDDNIVQLAPANSANTVDLGLVVGYNDGAAKHSGIVRDVSADSWKLFKGVTTNPTTTVEFTEGSLDNLAVNNVTVAGVVFTDGTQTSVGVPSITTISPKTASYELASTSDRDTIVEVNNAGATTLTIPTDATVNFPVGTTLDVLQTGAGQVTIAGASGVTVNSTPGLKLRAQWSSVTLLKRAANSWVVFGDTAA
jgi:hypothetical protein